jgi:pimeloyl-ACP methyl ester carboxylesterase
MADTFSEFSFSVAGFGTGGSSHSISCYQWSPQTSFNLPTVLCVHGLSRNGHDFDYLARTLSDKRTVISIDMPGRGKSDYLPEPEHYNYPAYVAQVAELFRQKNIQKVDWVGTSMGGIIAMMFAATFPGIINRLVLNDIGTVVSAEGLRRILTNAGSNITFTTRAEAEKEFRLRCATFGITDEEHWQHLFAYGIIDVPDGTCRFAYDPDILKTFIGTQDIEDIDLWSLWPSLEATPMLVLRGAESDILSRKTAEEMQNRHNNLTLHEVPGVGHVPALMDTGQVALVKDWLDKTQATSGAL